ncbi:nuclear fragile X mental retardation-interacting protein 1-like [Tropilaelaps mercedesae]|uniref:Nuclear fragile X mental retardation-interacting protein 1-like n=1 Tax=Tropilaelaps mercedesae TaxID=418985 RepID=A0A1V9XDX5_9ACAR|nr:nuclear fragile X mental retardation-interacting protein 1-like [Tropilaelaps mercedesae]
MALFNPFRETVPVPQKPVPAVQSLKCSPPPGNRTDGFRNGNAGFFQRGKPQRGALGFRGRGGRGRGGRPSGERDSRADPFNAFAPEELPAGILCDACERMFFSEEDFKEHCNLHVSCPHCKYAALRQLVDLHVKLVHDKHLASKVMEQSPEEIAEYLAERRRKFPRKQAPSEETGEPGGGTASPGSSTTNPAEAKKNVIYENNVRGNRRGKFGQFIVKDHARGHNDTRAYQQTPKPRNRKRRRRRQLHGQNQEQLAASAEDDGPEVLVGVPRFRGLPRTSEASAKFAREDSHDEAAMDVQDNISDVDDFTPAPPSQLPLAAATVLASLMATYTDSEDEELLTSPAAKVTRTEGPKKESLRQIKMVKSNQSEVRPCNGHTSTRSGQPILQTGVAGRPTTTTTTPHSVEVNAEHAISFEHVTSTKPSPSGGTVDPEVNIVIRSLVDRVSRLQGRCPANGASREAPRPSVRISQRKLSLLEKLLAKDIRHERNILLQCVDFVVQNKFFDNMGYDI